MLCSAAASTGGEDGVKVAVQCFASADGPHNNFAVSELRRLRRFQAYDRFKVHSVVEDLDEADIIIFIGPQINTLFDFRNSAAWRKYPEKCFVYCGGDRPLPLLPGLYVALERRFYAPSWARSSSYLRVAENTSIQASSFCNCDLLYSFAGAVSNHPTRRLLLDISHKRGVVLDTSRLPREWRQRDAALSSEDTYVETYVSLLSRSKFILCPRGIGVSSWRLFETLKAGRVPVIISDQWVPPDGPDWKQFSIRVSESEVKSIPAVLERRELDASELALRAKAAWDEWFAADVLFHRIVESCLAIQRGRRLPAKLQSWLYYRHLIRPYYLRHWLLADIKRVIWSK